MSCGTNNKSCYAKSCQRFYNNNSQALAAGETVQLVIAGNKVVDNGISIETEPQSFNTLKTGLYRITGDIVIEPSAAGDVIFSAYMDGVQLPCTVKRVTLATGNVSIHTETDINLGACCCNASHSFTFSLESVDTGAGSVVESCYGMLKLA